MHAIAKGRISILLRGFLIVFATIPVSSSSAQFAFFGQEDKMELVKRASDFVYNLEVDSGSFYINKVKSQLPDHPIVPLMEGVQLLWTYLPVLDDTTFNQFLSKMNETVERSQPGNGGKQNAELLFFELAARGLMAEYFADRGQYMKALGEANKAYKLIKDGFELTSEINEFLFTTGLYNYFREKYPQVYPIYKPFVWVFKSGDQELGLRQLDEATRTTIISRIEAHIYISYIYLRYEDTPEKAQEYLSFLVRQYPKNLYLATKFLESVRDDKYLESAPLELIYRLQESDRPYFQMAGNISRGLYEEKINANPKKAYAYYSQGIDKGKSLPSHGEFYKSLAYLGMGRILSTDRPETSRFYLNKALEFAETKDVKKEARRLLR